MNYFDVEFGFGNVHIKKKLWYLSAKKNIDAQLIFNDALQIIFDVIKFKS